MNDLTRKKWSFNITAPRFETIVVWTCSDSIVDDIDTYNLKEKMETIWCNEGFPLAHWSFKLVGDRKLSWALFRLLRAKLHNWPIFSVIIILEDLRIMHEQTWNRSASIEIFKKIRIEREGLQHDRDLPWRFLTLLNPLEMTAYLEQNTCSLSTYVVNSQK